MARVAVGMVNVAYPDPAAVSALCEKTNNTVYENVAFWAE
jgi:hypothetical protein